MSPPTYKTLSNNIYIYNNVFILYYIYNNVYNNITTIRKEKINLIKTMEKKTIIKETTKKFYDNELELSFKMTLAEYLKILDYRSRIKVVSVSEITQKWLMELEVPDGTMRTRIRKTEFIPPNSVEPCVIREFTTKYYWTDNNTRTELNSPIKEFEYSKVSSQYPNTKEIHKTRVTLLDTETKLIYTADVYDRESTETTEETADSNGVVNEEKMPQVIIEIEFKTKKQMDEFVVPEWLK